MQGEQEIDLHQLSHSLGEQFTEIALRRLLTTSNAINVVYGASAHVLSNHGVMRGHVTRALDRMGLTMNRRFHGAHVTVRDNNYVAPQPPGSVSRRSTNSTNWRSSMSRATTLDMTSSTGSYTPPFTASRNGTLSRAGSGIAGPSTPTNGPWTPQR